jgi:hypothetical protein
MATGYQQQTNKQRRKMNFYSNRLLIQIKEETQPKNLSARPICALWPVSLSMTAIHPSEMLFVTGCRQISQ